MTGTTRGLRWQQRTDVLRRTVGDTQLLLALDGDEPVALEGVGARIWGLLATPQRLTDLATAFADVPQTTRQRIADDIAGFLAQLEVEELVERV